MKRGREDEASRPEEKKSNELPGGGSSGSQGRTVAATQQETLEGNKAMKHLPQSAGSLGSSTGGIAGRRARRKKKAKTLDFPTQEPQKTPQLRFCLELLMRILNHKFATPFRVPVDPEALGLDDYFSVISEPMDLGTIRSRLIDHKYTDEQHFVRDVRLVFSNCIKYNSLQSDVGYMAQQLSELFEEQLTKMPVRKSGNKYTAASSASSSRAKYGSSQDASAAAAKSGADGGSASSSSSSSAKGSSSKGSSKGSSKSSGKQGASSGGGSRNKSKSGSSATSSRRSPKNVKPSQSAQSSTATKKAASSSSAPAGAKPKRKTGSRGKAKAKASRSKTSKASPLSTTSAGSRTQSKASSAVAASSDATGRSERPLLNTVRDSYGRRVQSKRTSPPHTPLPRAVDPHGGFHVLETGSSVSSGGLVERSSLTWEEWADLAHQGLLEMPELAFQARTVLELINRVSNVEIDTVNSPEAEAEAVKQLSDAMKTEISQKGSKARFVHNDRNGLFRLNTDVEHVRSSGPHADACSVCSEIGDLICCDSCPRVYHTDCLGDDGPVDEANIWHCPACAFLSGRRTVERPSSRGVGMPVLPDHNVAAEFPRTEFTRTEFPLDLVAPVSAKHHHVPQSPVAGNLQYVFGGDLWQ